MFYLKPKEKSRDQISEEILQLTEDMENMELGSDDIETAMNVLEQLKEAWNKPGSPFAGQPFDPSMFNLNEPIYFNTPEYEAQQRAKKEKEEQEKKKK